METDTESAYSSELVSLEQNLTSAQRDPTRKRVVCVLDTNILISNLTQLKEILQRSKSASHVMCAIPWIVLQELDRLKSANKYNKKNGGDSQLVSKAVQAIQFISRVLDEASSKVGANHVLKSNFLFETAVQVRIAIKNADCGFKKEALLKRLP